MMYLGDLVEAFIASVGLDRAAQWLRLHDPLTCDCPRRKAFLNRLHRVVEKRLKVRGAQ